MKGRGCTNPSERQTDRQPERGEGEVVAMRVRDRQTDRQIDRQKFKGEGWYQSE